MESLENTQRNLEELTSRHQLMPTLEAEFQHITEDKFKREVLCQMYLHKQATVPTMVGLFSPKWGDAQDVANLLVECVQEDLIDYDMETKKFMVVWGADPKIEKMLELYQFPLPMVCEPKTINHNNQGTGYFSERKNIVSNGGVIYCDEDVCLDHINRANKVPLAINLDVITSPQGKFMKPTRKTDENWDDYRKRVKQAEKFYDVSQEVMQHLLVLGNQFYLTHKYDRRGRTYAVGYHVNSQGTDYNKACLELAKEEVVT